VGLGWSEFYAHYEPDRCLQLVQVYVGKISVIVG